MFSLAWLFGWLARVRGLLRLRRFCLREAKREGWLGDVDRIVAELFPYVRVNIVLGWLGQGFVVPIEWGRDCGLLLCLACLRGRSVRPLVRFCACLGVRRPLMMIR